jgi:endonuclease YncB( thermonuclease family)
MDRKYQDTKRTSVVCKTVFFTVTTYNRDDDFRRLRHSSFRSTDVFNMRAWSRHYDGDTCQVVMQIYGEMRKFTLRIKGIDTPEIR